MQCPTFGTTLSPDICIKRQQISKQGFVTKKITSNDGNSREFHTELPVSFKSCVNCTTGKLVRLFPGMYIKKDFTRLINKQLKILKERGYVFKEEIDLICIIIAEKNEKLNDEERLDIVDHIARISQKLVLERSINGKPHKVLSATGCRITRYLREQRNKERDKQIDSSSIGA